MEASAYFDSLISQGYSSEQAKKYTLQYYPDFETTQPETNSIHISESTPPPIPLPTPNLGMPLLPPDDLSPPLHGGVISAPETLVPNNSQKESNLNRFSRRTCYCWSLWNFVYIGCLRRRR